MKQTAVEWLISQILAASINKETQEMHITLPKGVFEQAKAMEKQQIIESWDDGYANGYDLGRYDDQPNPDDAEQYYNETFKSE